MEKLVFFAMSDSGVEFFDVVHLINVYAIGSSGNRVLAASESTNYLPRTFVVNIPPEVKETIERHDEKFDKKPIDKILFHFDVQLYNITGGKDVIMDLNELVAMKQYPRSISPGHKRPYPNHLRRKTIAVHSDRLRQSYTTFYGILRLS
jgi:hypothetical protein